MGFAFNCLFKLMTPTNHGRGNIMISRKTLFIRFIFNNNYSKTFENNLSAFLSVLKNLKLNNPLIFNFKLIYSEVL